MSDANVSNDSGTATDQRHPVVPEDATIILPVRNMLLFPGVVLPLTIGRPSSIAAAQEAVRSGRKVGLLLQNDPDIEQPGPEHLRRVGTIAEILRYDDARPRTVATLSEASFISTKKHSLEVFQREVRR